MALSHTKLVWVLLQLLSSTFFFFYLKSATPYNANNLKYPKPTSPALLRSAMAQAREAGSWPESLHSVYDPRRAAEGPRSVHLCILENAGPAVLLMGPIQDAIPPFACLPEEVGCYLFWISDLCCCEFLQRFPPSPLLQSRVVKQHGLVIWITKSLLHHWAHVYCKIWLGFICLKHSSSHVIIQFAHSDLCNYS